MEIAIKVSLGRLQLGFALETLPELLSRHDVDWLPISFQHTVRLSQLPFHHRDPFDRLLVAQALVDDCDLVSRDTELDAYGVRRLW